MDELIEKESGGNLELNIICEENDGPSEKVPKLLKNNRFERRRKRVEQGKKRKLDDGRPMQPSSVQEPMPSKLKTQSNLDIIQSKEEEEEYNVEEEEYNVEEEDEVGEEVEEEKVIEEIKRNDSTFVKAKDQDGNKDNKDEEGENKKAESLLDPASDPSRKDSRRYHADTANLLQNEEDRAQYMAEFHARPLEIDRRSGATSLIKPSSYSSHLFDAKKVSSNPDERDSSVAIHSNEDAADDDDNLCAPFTSLGLEKRLAKALTGKLGLSNPTLIQTRVMEASFSGPLAKKKRHCNVFIQSETGSGKTLAYLLPLVQRLARSKNSNTRSSQGTSAVIICPTRELTLQTYKITKELLEAAGYTHIVPGVLSGGEKRKSEKARLRKGVGILISTPGRLLDHLNKTECLTTCLRKGNTNDDGLYFVLDEVDRLLDMGLGDQVEKIVASLNQILTHADQSSWRNVLVSATVSQNVQTLATKVLGGSKIDWEWVTASSNQCDTKKTTTQTDDTLSNDTDKHHPTASLSDSTPHQLAQLHMIVSAKLRLTSLIAFLVPRVKQKQRVVIFMATCDGVDYHYQLFQKMMSILDNDNDNEDGIFGKACSLLRLHGKVPQTERHNILQQFALNSSGQKKQASILIATDVAARGLNLPNVDWIVQYDPPCEMNDYIHRIGRAARAGNAGHSLLFLLPSERQYIDHLKSRGLNDITALALASTLQSAASICRDLTKEGIDQNSGHSRHEGEAFASSLQIKLEECVFQGSQAAATDKRKKNKRKGGQMTDVNANNNEKNTNLHSLAQRAFLSYLRAYPTKEKAVRYIFSTRALHIGHAAKSFALKDNPKALVKGSLSKQVKHKKGDFVEEDGKMMQSGKKRNKSLAFGK